MRYYLDTNILYFILSDRYDEIDRDVKAISDRIPLISSDHEFKDYTDQGLDFILNRR